MCAGVCVCVCVCVCVHVCVCVGGGGGGHGWGGGGAIRYVATLRFFTKRQEENKSLGLLE